MKELLFLVLKPSYTFWGSYLQEFYGAARLLTTPHATCVDQYVFFGAALPLDLVSGHISSTSGVRSMVTWVDLDLPRYLGRA